MYFMKYLSMSSNFPIKTWDFPVGHVRKPGGMAHPHPSGWQLLMCCTKNCTGSPHQPFLDM